MPTSCFCEEIREGTVKQPANAWSGLFFVLLGLLIMGRARKDQALKTHETFANPFTSQFAYAAVYGTALIVIGLGTTFFHASLTFIGQFFDVLGMYLLASFVLIYSLARHTNLNSKHFVVLYIGVNLILAYLLWQHAELRRYIFFLLVIATSISEIIRLNRDRITIQAGKLIWAISFFAIGSLIWTLDLTGTLCSPGSLLQGHAFWHLFSGLAGAALYFYYRSEHTPVR